MIRFVHDLGSTVLFVKSVLKTAATSRGNYSAIMEQMSYVMFRSLSTVIFAGVFVGAILVLQFNSMLEQYDAQIFLGGLNTSSVIREVGPLIISFLLAGKIGAFTAAELGTMRVTEQIDAIECLGTNALQYLVVPRFIAIVISSILLLGIGILISIGGSMLVAQYFCGINPLQYLSSVPRFTGFETLALGFFKSALYGTIVASVACYKGFTATGGARGVGQAVTASAVYTNLYIIFANFLTGKLVHIGHELYSAFSGELR